MTEANPNPADDSAGAERVDEVLRQLRAGVRQRQAELATLGAGAAEARHRMAELTAREYIQEPICISPRPVLGRWIVLARKVAFHGFMKWFLRPVIEQQNGFNQTASRLIQDLAQSQETMARQLRDLDARLLTLEKALEKHLQNE